ncbi:hypothetical protein D8S78_07335 [Natrialba swarupiae]|nr:hypothetical protein [Natrialba swarupiae]
MSQPPNSRRSDPPVGGRCVAERNETNVTINWQFTNENARTKLHRLYPTLEEVENQPLDAWEGTPTSVDCRLAKAQDETLPCRKQENDTLTWRNPPVGRSATENTLHLRQPERRNH